MPNEEKKPAKRARKEYAQEVLEIKISKEVKEIEAQETDYKNVFLWAINGLSSGLLYQGLLGIGFVSLVVFLGIQTGYSYFWSFVFLATALGISNILTLFLGLFVGSISDVYGKRKFLVIIFTGISIVFFTFIASWMNFYFTIVLFIIGNTLFQTSRIVYNSQVPFISEVNKRGTVNGISGVFHFGGSFLAVIITLILLFTCGEVTSLGDLQEGLVTANNIQFGGIRWIFPICAFIMLFSLIPYYFIKDKEKVKEKVRDQKGKIKQKNILKNSSKKIWEDKDDFLKNKNTILFFIGWFFVSASITLITIFFYEFVKRLIQKDEWLILVILAIIALAAMLSSYITGIFIDEIGPKVSISFTIVFAIIGITITSLAGFYHEIIKVVDFYKIVNIIEFDWWVIIFGSLFLGFALGGFWVIGKQFLIELSHPRKIGQAFGYMNVINQMGAVFGTIFFYGLISILNDIFKEDNSYRIALFFILGLFIISIIFFVFIKDFHPRYLLGERAPYKKTSARIKRKSKKMNFFVRLLIRLEYINQKFNVLLAAIKACGYFLMLASFVFGVEDFPWYIFLSVVLVGLPLLVMFVYVMEIFGESWRAEKWAQFDITESKIVEDKIEYFVLKDVISYKMDEDEREEGLEKMHQVLGLTQQRIRIEYEILQEIEEIRNESSPKN